MKALSLWQPWASLVALGAKQWETRSWETKHRGFLAIHAAVKTTAELRAIALRQPFQAALEAGQACDPLPRRSIVAVADLTEILTTMEWTRRYWNLAWNFPRAPRSAAEAEFAFGNYERGRFAWKLENIRALATPVPAKGGQQIWNIPPDVEEQINAQLLK